MRFFTDLLNCIFSEDGQFSSETETAIEQIYKLFVKEIENFRSYVEKLDSLNDEVKNDSFFTEMDHIFENKLKKLHNTRQR